MERTDFFNKTIIDGAEEYDHLYNNLSKFTMSYPAQYYRVRSDDLLRPDLISYKAYGTVKYWWIICYINSIHNIFEDIAVGDLLKIPSTIDIYTFYKRYRLV
jgi:hypothetical protein